MTYLLLLPASLAMTLLAYVLAPVLPLFSMRGWLVKGLGWFQTPDNSLYGDEGHEKRWGYAHSYWQMVAWLFRNPAYGFEWDGPLAALIKETDVPLTKGNPWVKNRHNAVAGWYFCRVGDYWNFKAVIPGVVGVAAFFLTWCGIIDLFASFVTLDWYVAAATLGVFGLRGNLAFMPEFGWKLQGYAQGRETAGRAMYVFSIRLTAFYLCIHPKED